jgi:hypothetical protein
MALSIRAEGGAERLPSKRLAEALGRHLLCERPIRLNSRSITQEAHRMKFFVSALVLLAVVTCASAFAQEKVPAPSVAATHSAAAPKSPAKSPATPSFWGGGTCVGTCTASCDSGPEEHYDMTSDACCTYYMFHTCADSSYPSSVEWWPTFSTGVGGCDDAVLCS